MEKPIAQFFDGERMVEVLPPEQPEEALDIHKMQKDIPTVNVKITAEEALERTASDKVKLLPEDEKEFNLKSKVSPERMKKYLHAENGETIEVFKLPKDKIKIIAFQNVNDRKTGFMAFYIGINGGLTYAELLLAYQKNGWMKEIGLLADEIKKRGLDADNLIYFFPPDTICGRKPNEQK